MVVCRGPRYYYDDEEPEWTHEEEEEEDPDYIPDRCAFCGVYHGTRNCWRQDNYLKEAA